MGNQKKNPGALAGAHRVVGGIETMRTGFDTYQFNLQSEDCLASRLICRRHGLSIHRARLVCHLAGLGGAI